MNSIKQLICNYLTDDEFYKIGNLDEKWYWRERTLPSFINACRFNCVGTLKYLSNGIKDKSYLYIDEACRFQRLDNVKYLHSIKFKGSQYAIKYSINNVELLEHLYENNYYIEGNIINDVILNNNMPVLKFLYTIGIHIEMHNISTMCIHANLETIKFIYEKEHKYFNNNSVDMASLNGRSDVVRFLLSKNIGFTKPALFTKYANTKDILIGRLDLLIA